ncbi:hypothetical protein, partial [Hydrogenivirga sp. 128-5-R1-1]|uniref:hypothetical protein n=1 Tax=Hydrogenivirga sp. 128-5-R1-1 TaxID=392423 RepID=UPI00015F145A
MDNIFRIRRYYFAGLFSSIFYFALLLIIVGKAKNPQIKDIYIYLITFTSVFIPYFVYLRVKGKLFILNTYKINLAVGHLPLIFGFLFSLLEENYIYLLVSFPIFFINYLILI